MERRLKVVYMFGYKERSHHHEEKQDNFCHVRTEHTMLVRQDRKEKREYSTTKGDGREGILGKRYGGCDDTKAAFPAVSNVSEVL
jgi:hypothetical protein